MREELNKVQNEMEKVKNRPVQFYDKLLWAFIGAAASGIVSVAMSVFAG